MKHLQGNEAGGKWRGGLLCFACDNNVDVGQRGLHLLPPSIEWHNTPPEHRQPEQVVRLLPVALFFFFLLFCFVLFCFVCVYVCVFVCLWLGCAGKCRQSGGNQARENQTSKLVLANGLGQGPRVFAIVVDF